jgi:hypothetical protein
MHENTRLQQSRVTRRRRDVFSVGDFDEGRVIGGSDITARF